MKVLTTEHVILTAVFFFCYLKKFELGLSKSIKLITGFKSQIRKKIYTYLNYIIVKLYVYYISISVILPTSLYDF